MLGVQPVPMCIVDGEDGVGESGMKYDLLLGMSDSGVARIQLFRGSSVMAKGWFVLTG